MLLTAMSAAAQTENLLEVFELAIESDPDFLAAGAEHRAAQEAVPQARAGLRPSAPPDVRDEVERAAAARRFQVRCPCPGSRASDLSPRSGNRARPGRRHDREGGCAVRRRAPGPHGARRRAVFQDTGGARRAQLRAGDAGGVRAAARPEPAAVRGRADRDHRRRGGQGRVRPVAGPAHRGGERARHRPRGAARDHRRVPGKARAARRAAPRDARAGRYRQVDGDRARAQPATAGREA